MKYNYNSTGPELSMLGEKRPNNPAYVHSSELFALGIADGEVVQVRSAHGTIPAVAKASDDVRPGVISMAHCWGASPQDKDAVDAKVQELGSNTNRLVRNRGDNARYSGMARQSCIPVTLERVASAETGAVA